MKYLILILNLTFAFFVLLLTFSSADAQSKIDSSSLQCAKYIKYRNVIYSFKHPDEKYVPIIVNCAINTDYYSWDYFYTGLKLTPSFTWDVNNSFLFVEQKFNFRRNDSNPFDRSRTIYQTKLNSLFFDNEFNQADLKIDSLRKAKKATEE
jgi:hypothetical protein